MDNIAFRLIINLILHLLFVCGSIVVCAEGRLGWGYIGEGDDKGAGRVLATKGRETISTILNSSFTHYLVLRPNHTLKAKIVRSYIV